jgi:hypothetical protein
MGYRLRFTDKEITPWGGMGLMKRLLDHVGFEEALKQCGLPQPQSNRGYRPEQLVTQFMLSVWCGANRFEHGEVTRFDPVLQKLFGYERMASFKTVMRLFGRFDQARNEQVYSSLYRWMYDQLSIGKTGGLTLDLDSTVMTRHGVGQEGAARGYNPNKPGRSSHHPLMAFCADTRMVANFWLRPGNAHTANNTIGFLASTQANLGDKRVGLLRADSGFSDTAFLSHLEEHGLNHIIALRLNQPLQRALVTEEGWWALDEGIELVSFDYQAPAWDKPRRVIGIRQDTGKRAQAKGKTLSLFPEDPVIGRYRFSALVTNLDLPAQVIWRIYRGRADCENRIKELKYDFGAGSFNMRSFWGTEATLNTVMLAFNLMSLMRQALLRTAMGSPGKDVQHTLQTLRYKLFAQAGYITHEGRRPILKLAMAMSKREWMSGLWDKAKNFDLPVKFTPAFSPVSSP